jgi:hypothetical protein
MIKSFVKFGVVCLLTTAVAGVPLQLQAQSENPAAEKSETRARKPEITPFNGKLKAVNQDARTIEVGSRTFKINPETKITRDGQPATLAQAVVGENVGGAYRKSEDGTLSATTLNLGKKAVSKP